MLLSNVNGVIERMKNQFYDMGFWNVVVQNFWNRVNYCFRPKICEMFRNRFCTKFDHFAIFSFWDMLDLVLNIRSELGTYTNSEIVYVRGSAPLKSPIYGGLLYSFALLLYSFSSFTFPSPPYRTYFYVFSGFLPIFIFLSLNNNNICIQPSLREAHATMGGGGVSAPAKKGTRILLEYSNHI